MRRVSSAYRSAVKKKLEISQFRGIDLYNSPANVSPERSPEAPNMIRDVPGKVRKRMGYHKVATYDGRINGIFELKLSSSSKEIVHAGRKLYVDGAQLYSNMKDERSKAWQIGDKLFIVDGKTYLYCDGTTVAPVTSIAYAPKITIARAPTGGGTAYEQINLIGEGFSESFLSNGTATVYQLSYDELRADYIEVSVMTATDVWSVRVKDVDYNFNPTLGTVTFVSGSIPAESPVDGADNVLIRAKKTRSDYVSRINKCDVSALFGVNSAADRLFVTGNPDYVNYDWFSEMNDATYFPVSSYSIIGMSSRIMGYSIVDDRLATHKADDADGRNIVLREGKMEDGKAAFPIVNTLQGASAVSSHAMAYLTNETLFLSKSGVFAVTPADVNGEKYTQNRSMFINRALEKEQELANSAAVAYKDFYVLSVGGRLYILDSLMKSYESGTPYSTHQYEAFLFTNINARTFYQKGGALRFGTPDGEIMEFYTDEKSDVSYQDNGAAITAYWDTPLLCGGSFYSLKSFKYLALKLFAAVSTGVNVLVEKGGVFSPLFEEYNKFRYLSFSSLRFSKLNFSGDSTPKSFGKKINVSKCDKARFRFLNDKPCEPFGIYNYSIEFFENGKIK